ncbi:MAG TPA: TonB family protein [Polyangiaceae bacterium]
MVLYGETWRFLADWRSLGRCSIVAAALVFGLTVTASANAQSKAAPAGSHETPASSHAVTMPEVEHFVEAEYPKQAREKGRSQADVTLKLDIDATGHVTGVEVLSGAGDGFDEAAVAAVRGFLFRPARSGERAVKSRIVYRYHFDAPVEAPAPVPVTAVLRGRVLAGTSEQPLAGARVVISLAGKPVLERTTDAQGGFEALGLEPGAYTVRVDADGFLPLEEAETLASSEEVEVKYRLNPPVTDSEEVIVRGDKPHREVTRRQLTRREFTRIPGTSGDALRSIQNLPGVARPPALSGELVVRGNADQSTPVFIDGLWLPSVYHFGGLSSVVPSELIDEINFYPGNFGVKYGRGLAGVVDAHFRETRDDGRYHGLFGVDLIDARLMLEGPVPGLKGWNFIGGFRRSHVDLWLTPLLEGEDTEITAAPVYYDYQFVLDTRPTQSSYLRIGLIGFEDRFRAFSESSAFGGSTDALNAIVGVATVYQTELSNTTSAEISVSFARSHQRFQESVIDIDTVAHGVLGRAELSQRLLPNLMLRAGLDLQVGPYRIDGQVPEQGVTGGPPPGPAFASPAREFDQSELFFLPAVYGELTTRAKRLEVVSWVRLDYTHMTRHYDVSPRLTARYDLVTSPRTTLKGGSGIFHQAPGLFEITLSDDATTLRSERNWQNSLGVEQQIGRHLEASVEGFYNVMDDLVTRRLGPNGVLRYDNSATGRVYGLEAMLRYVADDDFFGWISYTLSRSERTWSPGQPSQLFYADQPHNLTVLGSYNLGKGWELGARFRLSSGNLYTPCNGGLLNSSSTTYICVSGKQNSERLSTFHQLDVRVDKRWVFSSWTLGIYLDLINAYNNISEDAPAYSFDFSQRGTTSQNLPIVPSLGIRGEF